MSFTKVFGGANPLPQVVMVASAGASFNFTVAASTSTGGSWLSVSTVPSCGLCSTPEAVTATVNANVTLAAGSYTGQIVVTSQFGAVAMTVPVTLIVAPAGGAFLDDLPGQASFFLKTAGTSITSQDLQVRNGGPGTLSWTATSSTSDGGAWLLLSAAAGTAPSTVTVNVNAAALPGAGLIAGTFVGQLVFQGNATTVTVPVSVTVGDNVYRQINPISFVKPFGGADPLPQTLTVPAPAPISIFA